MTEHVVSLAGGIDLCYETFGSAHKPAILLVMGLGGPMGWWTTEFCTRLAGRGYHVIRFDNRDTGRSTKLRQHKVSTARILGSFLGVGRAPYGLIDFAGDAFGLLDHLAIDRVHLAGVSMGGMIAQTMAIDRPERVLSLTSIMSTTGKRTVGWQHPRVIPAMLGSAGHSREAYIERSLRTAAIIGSPIFPGDEATARERAGETYDRGWSASGVGRHMLAVLTQPDRTADLGKLTIPATVVHGLRDRLVDPSGGRATAAAIPGAEFLAIAGMGHDIPAQLYDTLIEAITRTAERAAAAE